ncbi:hypothetical protein SRRS_32830 [Sporomusa rhizae]
MYIFAHSDYIVYIFLTGLSIPVEQRLHLERQQLSILAKIMSSAFFKNSTQFISIIGMVETTNW